MEKEVMITISGGANVGKSTLGAYIMKALAEVGITKTCLIDNDLDPEKVDESLQRLETRPNHMSNLQVNIFTKQTAKKPKNNTDEVSLYERLKNARKAYQTALEYGYCPHVGVDGLKEFSGCRPDEIASRICNLISLL